MTKTRLQFDFTEDALGELDELKGSSRLRTKMLPFWWKRMDGSVR